MSTYYVPDAGDVMAERKDEAVSSWNLQSSPPTSPRPAPSFTSLISPIPSFPAWLHIDPASLWLALGVGSHYQCGLGSQLASESGSTAYELCDLGKTTSSL